MANKLDDQDNGTVLDQKLPEIDPDRYNEVARCAQLLGVQLIESSFNITPDFFDTEKEGKYKLEFNDFDGTFDEEGNIATSMFQFESCKKIGRKKAFSAKDKFVVFYGIDAECDHVHAIAFARKVGLMAAYPYFRAHVAHLASLANADIPVLPTISSMPVKGKVKKESAS